MEIQKGGNLYDKGNNITAVVQSNPSLVLFKPCGIQVGVTLRDVFRLLAQNLNFFDLLLPTHCKDIVTSGLECKTIELDSCEYESEILYLEVYWRLQLEFHDDVGKSRYVPFECTPLPSGEVRVTRKGESTIVKETTRTLSNLSRASFHGSDADGNELGLDMTELEDIIDLPVRLKSTTDFKQTDINDLCTEESVQVDFTLIQILFAIVWELSFFGTPAQKTTFIAKQSELIE